MFGYSKIAWTALLNAGIRTVLKHYQVTSGVIVFDDTDNKRSKKTPKIAGTHKFKDKTTGGYCNGQELIFMVLMTKIITLPIGFCFYKPDPVVSAWNKKNKRLKAQGIHPSERPPCPRRDDVNYPTKQVLAQQMLRDFCNDFPDVKIQAVLADALYGQATFMDSSQSITEGAQCISQLKSNQKVRSKGQCYTSLEDYFSRQVGVETTLTVRGNKQKKVMMLAARLHVKAHKKKRFVVALKYEGESDYRYLVATNLSWRHQDIARVYTLRCLVEVLSRTGSFIMAGIS